MMSPLASSNNANKIETVPVGGILTPLPDQEHGNSTASDVTDFKEGFQRGGAVRGCVGEKELLAHTIGDDIYQSSKCDDPVSTSTNESSSSESKDEISNPSSATKPSRRTREKIVGGFDKTKPLRYRNLACKLYDSIGIEDHFQGTAKNKTHAKSSEPDRDDMHLIVLQHGFQGVSYDMRLLRNSLLSEFPTNTLV
jgi:hypothetical protein